MFPNRLEIGVDHDPHVWPLEEIIGIQPSHHRGHKCVQIRYIPSSFPYSEIHVAKFGEKCFYKLQFCLKTAMVCFFQMVILVSTGKYFPGYQISGKIAHSTRLDEYISR